MRMRRVTWRGGRGHPKPHICNQRPQLLWGYNDNLGEFTWEHPHNSKAVLVKSGPKMAVFRELRGLNVKLLFSNPEKAHPCAEPRHLAYYAWKSVRAQNPVGGCGCGALEEVKNPKKNPS